MKKRKVYTERFEAIVKELEGRGLGNIPTDKLLKLALLYGERARAERSSFDFLED